MKIGMGDDAFISVLYLHYKYRAHRIFHFLPLTERRPSMALHPPVPHSFTEHGHIRAQSDIRESSPG
jgi:hypothetical protein